MVAAIVVRRQLSHDDAVDLPERDQLLSADAHAQVALLQHSRLLVALDDDVRPGDAVNQTRCRESGTRIMAPSVISSRSPTREGAAPEEDDREGAEPKQAA